MEGLLFKDFVTKWILNIDLIILMVILGPLLDGCYGNGITEESRSCYHEPDYKQVIYDVDLEPGTPHHEIHKRSATKPLRIHLYYDYSVSNLPSDHQTLIKTKVSEAAAYWESTLSVRPTRAPIRLNRQCVSEQVRYFNRMRYCRDGCASVTLCGDVRVPLDHQHACDWWDSEANKYYNPPESQPGVSGVDFILYVAAIPSQKCEWQKTVAFAAHCQLEQALDRPVAGYISICPHSVSTSIHKHEELLYTIKHEILHALGFTAGLYAFYRDPQGQPLTARDIHTNKPEDFNYNIGMYQWSGRVVQRFERPAWRLKGQTISRYVDMIVLPNVVREVRSHFNCPTLEGGELEDQGINGTAYTHWEKRVFENEFMTGTYTQNPVISRVTLALMQDTGWYSVRYSNAMDLEWGRNLGCDFVMKSCYEWMETRIQRNQDIHPFCIQATRGAPVTDCTKNRKSVAICNLSEFTRDLPLKYQYFKSIPGVNPADVGRYGGSVSLADYCPYLQEFVWKQEADFLRGSRCALSHNTMQQSQNYLLEKYSPRAKCFNHGSKWALQRCKSVFTPHSGSGCYEYDCTNENGLTVFVMGKAYPCYYEGQEIYISHVDSTWLYRGNITCPSCAEVCQDYGITCPPEDRRVYITRTQSNYIPCSRGTSLSSSAKLLANVMLFCCIFNVFKR